MVEVKDGDFIFIKFDKSDPNNDSSINGVYEVASVETDEYSSDYPISLYKYNAPLDYMGERESTEACNNHEVVAVVQKTKLIELAFS